MLVLLLMEIKKPLQTERFKSQDSVISGVIHLFLPAKRLFHMRKLFIAILLVPFVSMAQKKQITLEDIFKSKTFQGDVAPGFSEQPLDSIINVSDVKDENGKQLSTKDYTLSEDKKRIIFLTESEPIYRRS